MGESLQQERESPWALTLTDPVPDAFEFSPSDQGLEGYSRDPGFDQNTVRDSGKRKIS